MNCFCTVSQRMLKEYVLHRSILGGTYVHICDQVTQHRDHGLSGEKLITVSFV